jgi:hypothetical protein
MTPYKLERLFRGLGLPYSEDSQGVFTLDARVDVALTEDEEGESIIIVSAGGQVVASVNTLRALKRRLAQLFTEQPPAQHM